MGKKIISFSLWGPHDFYNKGAIANIVEAKVVYPDWICRFYVHDKSPVIDVLRSMSCEVVPMSFANSWTPLFWRFLAMDDPSVDYCIFRDCDSRVNTKEAAAVSAWIASGKKAHLMKDWPAPHATETILAGMWGIRANTIPNVRQLIDDWVRTENIHNKYTDQDFLRYKIWPFIKDDVLNHGVDSPAGKGVPFPPYAPMKYGEYIGQPINP
jgi:hypothetical protein